MTDRAMDAEMTGADGPPPQRGGVLARLRGMRGQLLAAVMLKGFGVGSAMLLQWLVLKLYGPTGQGLFGLMATTVSLAGVLALFGQDYLAMRNIAGDLAEGKPGRARAQARTALRIVLVGCVVVSLGLVITARVFDEVLGSRATALIVLAGLPTSAAFALGRLYSFTARASGMIFKSQLIDGPIPSGVGVVLVAMLFLVPERPPVWVLGVTYSLANIVALWLGFAIGRRAIASWPETGDTVPARPLAIAGISRVFAYGSPFLVDWLIIFTMTAAWGSAAAGLMRIPALFIGAMYLIAIAFDAVFAPRIAAALRLGDLAGARRLYRSYVKGSLGLNVPVAIVLLAAPGLVLGVFGAEFVPYANAMRVGVVLQLVTIAMGPAGLLLVMSHNENLTYISNLVGVGVAAVACAIVIPLYGVPAGIAASAAVTLAKRITEFALASWKLRLRLF